MTRIWLVTLLISILSNFCTVASKSVTSERIITNKDSLVSGVPIDYRYNESDTGYMARSEGLQSVPGSPKSEEEGRFSNGFCNCDCFEGCHRQTDERDPQFCENDGSEFVFLPEYSQCFQILEKGWPCKENELLVKVEVRGRPSTTNCASIDDDSNQVASGEIDIHHDIDSQGIPLIPNECPDGKKFSKLLEGCVGKFNFSF